MSEFKPLKQKLYQYLVFSSHCCNDSESQTGVQLSLLLVLLSPARFPPQSLHWRSFCLPVLWFVNVCLGNFIAPFGEQLNCAICGFLYRLTKHTYTIYNYICMCMWGMCVWQICVAHKNPNASFATLAKITFSTLFVWLIKRTSQNLWGYT